MVPYPCILFSTLTGIVILWKSLSSERSQIDLLYLQDTSQGEKYAATFQDPSPLPFKPSPPTLNLCLVQTMCDIHHVSGNDYDIQINSRGQRVCADIEGTKEAGEEEEEEGGVSFINSPAVVETPCWTVNHQWPQNYRHGSPADSKNCLLTAIYGPASQAEPPLSLASPRCAHILTSSRHQLLLGLPAHWLTASCLKAAFPPAP